MEQFVCFSVLLVDIRIGVHEKLLVDWQEVVRRVHSAQHAESIVHLGVQWVVWCLRVVVSLGVVVEIWIQGL